MLDVDWLNRLLQQDLTSTNLASSPDKNELLKRFSKEELATLEEELENSMVEDLPADLLNENYPDNPEGEIALATDDTEEYRLPESSQGKSGESKSSEEKLKIFLAAWNPEILTEKT